MALDFHRLRTAAERQKAYPVVPKGIFREAEAQLGFPLPPVLTKLYSEVAGGGFGPGSRLYRLYDPENPLDEDTIVGLYIYLTRKQMPFPWPEKLLPLVHWGCAIYSCVDVSNLSFLPMIRFYSDCQELELSFCSEMRSFEKWIQAWLEGEDLSEIKSR